MSEGEMRTLESLLGPAALARVRAPLEQAWTLPPAAYTDPEVFRLETRTLFAHEWSCVAHESQLEQPGDHVTADLAGEPLVVVRGRDGVLRALSAVCRHRAMPLLSGSGRSGRFVCPYHHWTYELDGTLRSAPMMQGSRAFDRQGCRLPAYPLAMWNGFVFVSRQPRAPLLPCLAGLSAWLPRRRLDNLVVARTLEFDSPWNWKVLVENFMEAYHHIGTHRSSLEGVYPARLSTVPDNGGEPWAILHMPAEAATDSGEDALLAVCVFPTLLIAMSAGAVFWYQLEPGGCDAMRLRIHVLVDREGTADEAALDALAAEVRFIHEEDIAANLGVWRGLNAPGTAQGPLSAFEKAIWQLNQQYLDSLSG